MWGGHSCPPLLPSECGADILVRQLLPSECGADILVRQLLQSECGADTLVRRCFRVSVGRTFLSALQAGLVDRLAGRNARPTQASPHDVSMAVDCPEHRRVIV